MGLIAAALAAIVIAIAVAGIPLRRQTLKPSYCAQVLPFLFSFLF